MSLTTPLGSIAVPFGGSYLEFYKVIPTRNYYGASGYISLTSMTRFLCAQGGFKRLPFAV